MSEALKTRFTDLPDDLRLAVRHVVANHGGEVSHYTECGACQVALPSDPDACRAMAEELAALDMTGEDRFTWFPLGSDNPPESLRHYGLGTAACPRGDRPSYWKYRNFYFAGSHDSVARWLVCHECGAPAKVSLYDEEGIDGWRWDHPDGREWTAIGDHDSPPPPHPFLRM